MSSWLVIGASSFTGTHFCRYLRERGEDVAEESLRGDCTRLFTHTDEYVVNFAAANVVAPSWKYSEDYLRVNLLQQDIMWYVMTSAPPRRYLHISTPEVYGSTHGWITEDAPYNPSTPYAVSRAAAEMMLKCYHRQYGLPVVFTRACNVYGPGQQLYRLIPKLIVSIKKGEKFKLEGGGQSARAFIHVNDVCEATYLIATKGTPGEAYHITSGDYQSISGVVRLVCEQMGKDMAEVVEEAPERPGKDADYQLRGDKLLALGWTQKVRLMPGIRSVIEWVDREWDTLKDQPMEYEFRP